MNELYTRAVEWRDGIRSVLYLAITLPTVSPDRDSRDPMFSRSTSFHAAALEANSCLVPIRFDLRTPLS
jgi:hypothetical protein